MSAEGERCCIVQDLHCMKTSLELLVQCTRCAPLSFEPHRKTLTSSFRYHAFHDPEIIYKQISKDAIDITQRRDARGESSLPNPIVEGFCPYPRRFLRDLGPRG